MTLKDISHGPDWISWAVLVFLAVMSIVLLTGHGSGFIAGYNTAGAEEKAKYDEKKLCRVVGGGMLIVTLIVFTMLIGETVLPYWFAYVTLCVIIVDVVGMIILANTHCKR